MENKWKLLGVFLLRRLTRPFKHPEFVFYFFIVILGLGAIGIYTAVLNTEIPKTKDEHIIASISSYFLALIATGTVELIFIQEKNIRKAVMLLAIATIFINTILFFVSITTNSYVYSFIGLAISTIIWWIANAENTNIIDGNFDANIRTEARNIHGQNW